jgi:hypothetical protein
MITNNKKSKRKPGRPKLPKAEARSKIVLVRVTTDEMKRIAQAAKAEDKTVTGWAREKFGLN